MAYNKIKAEKRTNLKKSRTKEIRSSGKIPAVYYKKGGESFSISIGKISFMKSLHGDSLLYDLDIDGDVKKSVIRDIQWHPVSDEAQHVDFMGVDLDQVIKIRVPVITEGASVGVAEGGVLHQSKWYLRIKAEAENVPNKIVVNVEELGIGESIAVSDLDLGEIEIMDDPSISIVSVVEPTEVVTTEEVLEAAEELEALEEEELAEGEEAEEGVEGEETEEGEEAEEEEKE